MRGRLRPIWQRRMAAGKWSSCWRHGNRTGGNDWLSCFDLVFCDCGVVAEDYCSDEHGAKQQQHARHVSVEYGIAQQNSYQPEGSAGRAESEIKLLLRAMREAQQDQKDGQNDHINSQKNDAARDLLAVNRKCLGMRSEEHT